MKTTADLREHLFATLDALRDKENPMDVARAKAVSDVAQTLINVARVELDYLRQIDGRESAFIALAGKDDTPAALPPGIVGITRHRLAG